MNIKKVAAILVLAAIMAFAASGCDGTKASVAVTGVSVSPKTLSITVGETGSLLYTVQPQNATKKTVAWSSDNTAVATVKGGVVTGVSIGTATITVKSAADGKKFDTCVVTVGEPVEVAGILFSETELSVGVGESATLAVTVLPAGASAAGLIWSSDDQSVAQVNNGVVTGVALGSAKITVKSPTNDAVFAECQVTITGVVPITGIALNRQTHTVRVGRATTLSVVFTPTNASNRSVTWASSNPAVATVINGSVRGITEGVATITVTSEGNSSLSAACTVTVLPPPDPGENPYLDRPFYDGPTGTKAGVDYPAATGSPYVDTEEAFTGLNIRQSAGKMEVIWPAISNAASYEVYRAGSRLGPRARLATVSAQGGVPGVSGWGYVDATPNPAKYENYYFIVAKNSSGADIPLAKPANPSGWQGNNPNPHINCQWISLEKKIFGEYTYFYDAKYDSMSAIGTEINAVGSSMTGAGNESQMSSSRTAFYLKPGSYSGLANLNVTFYMSVSGLGITPDLTKISGIRSAGALGSNVTHNFWRSVENVETAAGSTFEWSVSQAAPARRIYARGGAAYYIGGWASGGFVADSYITGNINMGGQQQFYHRNCHFQQNWSGGAWNMVQQGCSSGTTTNTGWKQNNYKTGGIYTTIEDVPIIREKPFLYLDTDEDEYKVFVPGLRYDSHGISWMEEDGKTITPGEGYSVDIEEFYVSKPGDSAKKLNAKMDAGKHLFVSPGVYPMSEPLRVTQPNTILLGTGLASIHPDTNNRYGALLVDDVPGVIVAHLLADGYTRSTYIVRFGGMEAGLGKGQDHSDNPSQYSDLFCRVGGAFGGTMRADVSLQINSANVIGDHCWLWAADHGRGGYNAQHGLIVSGDDVTLYGTFVEHYEKYNTIWYGNGGKNYFYQYETPYKGWTGNSPHAADGNTGWAAFKVWNDVESFYGMAFGMYGVGANQRCPNAVECPNKPGVKFEALFTKSLDGAGGRGHAMNVINGTGGSTNTGNGEKRVAVFENGVATIGTGGGSTATGKDIPNEPVLLPSGPLS